MRRDMVQSLAELLKRKQGEIIYIPEVDSYQWIYKNYSSIITLQLKTSHTILTWKGLIKLGYIPNKTSALRAMELVKPIINRRLKNE